jgi:hypothetical protein
VRFEVFTAVTMKNAVFWDVAPCRSCVNRRFGGTYLKMDVIRSCETSFKKIYTRRHIPEDVILQVLKCYLDELQGSVYFSRDNFLQYRNPVGFWVRDWLLIQRVLSSTASQIFLMDFSAHRLMYSLLPNIKL